MSSSVVMSQSVAEQTEMALVTRNNVRETLEKIHSQSTDLMHLSVHWKDLEGRYDSIQKSIDDQLCDLNTKEQQLEWKSKYLKQKSNYMDAKMSEISSREMELEAEKVELADRSLEVDQTYKLVAMCHERAEERARSLEEKLRLHRVKKRRLVTKENRLKVKRKLMKRKFEVLKNSSEELVTKEKRLYDFEAELNDRKKNLMEMEMGISKRIQEIEPREKRLDDRETELKRKETRCRNRYKLLIQKEKCMNFVLARVKGKEVDDCDIRFYITMSGRDVICHLNKSPDDLNMMGDEVRSALMLSSNPAKLVLDAMQEFYGSANENSDMSIVRRSCIVLLEQFSELEVKIGIQEKERALLLAVQWKERMKADNYHNLEVVGFLQLVCAFRLTNDFDKDELAKSIAATAHHATALCRRLGLEDKVHDIVQYLIQDMRAVEAVKFIHEFNLKDKFPPAPILRDYLETIVSAADDFSTGTVTQKEATDVIVTALLSVIKCIKDFNLDSEYPTQILEEQVLCFKKLNECFSSSDEDQ